MSMWTFVSNHGVVLVCLAQEPDMRMSDIARRVGITERAAHRIVADLEAAGYISRQRIGRRNHYVVHADAALRHPAIAHKTVGHLLRLARPTDDEPSQQSGPPAGASVTVPSEPEPSSDREARVGRPRPRAGGRTKTLAF